jgi:hypothetical protein
MSHGPTVFVFGHENLAFATFLDRYIPAIDTMLVDATTSWLVGDRPGAETLALEYLKSRTERVNIFHCGKEPRYFPSIAGTPADRWQWRRTFASYQQLVDAAIAECTHFVAEDNGWDITRYDGTRRAIDACRAANRTDLVAASPNAPLTGATRAHSLIDRLEVRHGTARAFAHILVDLFPPWFDFAPHHFAVLAWDLGLHLVIAGPSPSRSPTIGVISTSDSRNMRCATLQTQNANGSAATISMHYEPSDEHRARAATEIASMLDQLYPARAKTP